MPKAHRRGFQPALSVRRLYGKKAPAGRYSSGSASLFVAAASAAALGEEGLGLAIIPLMLRHVVATRIGSEFLLSSQDYNSVLLSHWVLNPGYPLFHIAGVLTVWVHASIGIHFWLRVGEFENSPKLEAEHLLANLVDSTREPAVSSTPRAFRTSNGAPTSYSRSRI